MDENANRLSDEYVKGRIQKDIDMFEGSIKEVDDIDAIAEKRVKKVVELSKMYASDSKSYLSKGDLYTSFSCISYAHGLLDAIKGIYGKEIDI
ncbi:protein containing DUF357 [mine drainage metagenome]|uniref:Protein containing DUF357 n=1 Tax=mine drainage metagenome TaxID=410659 RepID=T1AW30_9ZZZZ